MYFKKCLLDDKEILLHIKETHLPLKCRQCNFCFYNITDIVEKICCDRCSFSKSEEFRDSPQENKSTLISTNWKVNTEQRMRELSTSTPMGSGTYLMRSTFDPAIISPPVNESSSIVCSSRISGVTPINNSEAIISPPLPLVTPLRSIISKGKTPGNENRRVTFSEPADIVYPKTHPFPSMSPSTRKLQYSQFISDIKSI